MSPPKVRRERKLPVKQLSILGTPELPEAVVTLMLLTLHSGMQIRRAHSEHVALPLSARDGEVVWRTRE